MVWPAIRQALDYNLVMQTYILDAQTIDPTQDPAAFLCSFYDLPAQTLPEIKRFLYADPKVRITEVFNWPVAHENWKAIASTLEIIQQHSASFYVIWGPEAVDAVTLDVKMLEDQGKPVIDSTTTICTEDDQ